MKGGNTIKKYLFQIPFYVIFFFLILSKGAMASGSSLPSKGWIDAPKYNQNLQGKLSVHGWLLDGNGVSNIQILVDGKNVGEAIYGDSRPDVEKAYPAYNNANSGYHFILDSGNFTNGPHTFAIKEISKDGHTFIQQRPINIGNLPPKGWIDYPKEGQTVRGAINLHGWLLDGSGVSKIEVFVDGQSEGQATYGDSRTDVQKLNPWYNNVNSGYHFILDTRKLVNGRHKIVIKETSENGGTYIQYRHITVDNLPAKGWIDAPKYGQVIQGETNVRGWMLDGSDVSKIEVLLDGNTVGKAIYGDARPDVQKAIPIYQNANSGYHFVLDTRKFTNGQHTLTIKETGENKESYAQSRPVVISNLPAKGWIDTPKFNQVLQGKTQIKGWMLDGRGVSNLEVMIDGNKLGDANYGISRPDVEKINPQYQNANSGFQLPLNTFNLTNGQHTLTIKETALNGTSYELTQSFSVDNPVLVSSLNLPVYSSFNDLQYYNQQSVNFYLNYGTGITVLDHQLYATKIKTSDGKTGWVQSAYLDDNPASDWWYVKDARNFRDGPGTSFNKVGTISTGDFVHVLAHKVLSGTYTDWYKVVDQSGNEGWIWGDITSGTPNKGYDLIKYESDKVGKTTNLIDLFTPLNKTNSDVTEQQINSFIDSHTGGQTTLMTGMGKAFLEAAKQSGLNVIYLVSHAGLETGWGTSTLVNQKYNYYGINATDLNTIQNAYTFDSKEGGIVAGAIWISKYYVNRNSSVSNYDPYPQPTIDSMRFNNNLHQYATDDAWAAKIGYIMNQFESTLK